MLFAGRISPGRGGPRETSKLVSRHKQSHGGVIFRDSFDLVLTQFRSYRAHAVVDVVAALALKESVELGKRIFLPLSGENRRFDRAARMHAVTGGAARNSPRRNSVFYEGNAKQTKNQPVKLDLSTRPQFLRQRNKRARRAAKCRSLRG